jgi:glycosyltransferase involved in cell wall biosynthesis
MPRVSVIVPAHDSADVLPQSLGSVLAQTYGDWEAIVCDDASSDDTAERAAAFGERVRVIRSEVNRGPAGARNVALRHATGELVAFLDADDWWEPEFLERQVARYDAESARPGPPVGIVAADARIHAGDGVLPHTYLDQFRAVEPLTLERVLRRDVIYVSCLVPRAAGELVGWFDEELFGTEDHGLWIKILERGYRAVLTREPLCHYRWSAGSVSSDVARQGHNNQRTYRLAIARGRLTPRQRRIARAELRYNRALEAVASAAFGGGGHLAAARRLARELPLLATVVLTRPHHWIDWARALRGSGRPA